MSNPSPNPVNHLWHPNMTPEQKSSYRKAKHRWHAARSRRLRGRDVPEGSVTRGERVSYDNPEHTADIDNHYLPFVGDYDGDGFNDSE